MLNVLLESRASTERRRGGTVVSVVAHTAVIAAVVAATAQKPVRAEETPRPSEIPVRIFPLVPTPQPTARPSGSATPTSVAAAPIPAAPPLRIDFSRIPVGIPDGPLVDPGASRMPIAAGSGLVTDPYGGSGVAVDPGSVVEERHVERAARLTAAPAPRYPERMRALGVEGRVLVQFVVDTTGRVELDGVRVLTSPHDDFTLAVRQVLPRLRFVPAEVRGGKVRMLAQMPFEFALDRR